MNIINRPEGYFVLDHTGQRISPALESNSAAADFKQFVQDYGLPTGSPDHQSILDWFNNLRGKKRAGNLPDPTSFRSSSTSGGTTDPLTDQPGIETGPYNYGSNGGRNAGSTGFDGGNTYSGF